MDLDYGQEEEFSKKEGKYTRKNITALLTWVRRKPVRMAVERMCRMWETAGDEAETEILLVRDLQNNRPV